MRKINVRTVETQPCTEEVMKMFCEMFLDSKKGTAPTVPNKNKNNVIIKQKRGVVKNENTIKG